MNKTTKYIVGLVVVVLVALVISAISPKQSGLNEPIKIGYIGPLSGDGASYGETEKNAIELALTELALDSKSKNPKFEIVYEDGKCNGKDAASAIQKLISVDKVSIIFGGTCSAETLSMAPIAEQNKVLLLSAFSSNPEITKSGDYIFRNSPKDTDVAYLDAETIAKKYKKVALVSENTDYSLGVREVMKTVFSEKKIEVVADETYTNTGSGVSDFRSILTKIKSSNPEVLYINPGTSAKAGGIMVKQARELGITAPIHGNFSLGTPDALGTGGEYMNGVVISDASNLANNGNKVLEAYKNQFGKDPANNLLMGASYDRVIILKDAVLKVGMDVEKIKQYLYGITNFSGTIGEYHFDENGDVVGVGFINVVLKDGQKIPYSG
jgi:branched-chain amino acid transport system substrate-binding protein